MPSTHSPGSQERTAELRPRWRAAARLRASHTPKPLEGMAPSLLPLFRAQLLEREVNGSSLRAPGWSRFLQARGPAQQQEFGWGKGAVLTCPRSPPLPDPLFTPISASLWSPTPQPPLPRAYGQLLPPSPFLAFLPLSTSSHNFTEVQTPRPWCPWLPAQSSSGQASLRPR